MIEIELRNKDLTPMWFLLGTDINLTYDSPGPVKVDEKELTEFQLNDLKRAIQSGVIKNISADSDTKVALTPQQLIEQQRLLRVKKIQDFLAQKLKDLRKVIPEQNISDLRLMLDEEKAGKSRKTIISLIESSISKHQRSVFKQVGKEDINNNQRDFKDIFGRMNAQYVENIGSTFEEDFEEVEIILE